MAENQKTVLFLPPSVTHIKLKRWLETLHTASNGRVRNLPAIGGRIYMSHAKQKEVKKFGFQRE